uniref:Uncharacterized protein n=1 Tax=Meloidogyne enterolobii TaxID=390850 RepID=A0A6V7VLL2_MELEN|nr:unnamed protein product [Meloidogyne enterolobii]
MKIFENLTEKEIGIFNGFKEGILILVRKTNENNLNDGELVFEEEKMFELVYQKWFLFEDEYYLMNDYCLIAEKLIDEED